MNLEQVKKELESNSEYVESVISFDEVTVIECGEYIQKAKSGFNLYVAIVSANEVVSYHADNEELERVEL